MQQNKPLAGIQTMHSRSDGSWVVLLCRIPNMLPPIGNDQDPPDDVLSLLGNFIR